MGGFFKSVLKIFPVAWFIIVPVAYSNQFRKSQGNFSPGESIKFEYSVYKCGVPAAGHSVLVKHEQLFGFADLRSSCHKCQVGLQ